MADASQHNGSTISLYRLTDVSNNYSQHPGSYN
jgi:hypothetical protein